MADVLKKTILNSDYTLKIGDFTPGKNGTLLIEQDSTGGHILNLPSDLKYRGSVALNTEAGGLSLLKYVVDDEGVLFTVSYPVATSGSTGSAGDYYNKLQSDSRYYPKFSNPSGYLTSVSWGDIESKPTLFDGDYYSLSNYPTLLTQFINNLGNYGNWITEAEGSLLFQPLEDQRLSRNRDVRFNSITSTSYTSGSFGTGFRIDGFGNAEFENLSVRNVFNVNELKVNKITASNGSIAVTDGIKINTVTVVSGGYLCEIETGSGTIAVPFAVDDLVRCQVYNGTGVKYYLRKVIAVTTDSFTLALTAIAGIDIPEPLDEVVRFGNQTDTDRQGLLYLTSSDSNSPYLDVLDGVTSADLSGKTKVRLGKLDGITDADVGSLSGYGLYSENAFIKGTVHVTGGNAATKNYADTVASASQALAQDYADAVSESKANLAKAAAEAASNEYSDALKQALLDGEISDLEEATLANLLEAKSYAETKAAEAEANAISTASSDATTKSNAALSSAQEYADSVAESRANVAQAAAILAASNDATTKANAAKAAAEAASATYADTVSNAAASAAELAAAVDASNKAQQAYEDAVEAAEIARQALADSLGAMAFEDAVEVSKLGTTIITGGYLENNLIDTDFLRATIINASQIVIDGGGATTAYANSVANTAQANAISTASGDATSKANAAESNAIATATYNDNVVSIAGGKIFNKPYSISSDPVNGAFVLHTNIQFIANYMTSIKIKGYNYVDTNNDIDLTIGFYAYASGLPDGIFHSAGYINKGSFIVDRVRLAHNTATNTVSIIIGNDVKGWSYPKINVESCTITYTTPPDSFRDGWTGSFTSDFTGLSVITDISGTIAESTAGSQARTATALNSAVSQATTLASNAQSAAQSYAASQSAYEREVAKAYADGIVDTEEAARLAEAAAKLIEAKAYADSTASAAQSAAITAANAYAVSVAQSKADIAQANALSGAASDAQLRADSAYTSAVSAAQTYANTVSNAAATQAEINAAATSAAQSASAYSSAVAAAEAARIAFANTLKTMAYRDVVSAAELDSTIISGGKIVTTLLDADYIKSSIINVTYLNALDIISKRIRTAASGQRIEMLEDNTIKFYKTGITDAVVTIDDNLVLEDTSSFPDVYGPGICIGDRNSMTNGQTLIGRKRVSISGQLDVYGQSNLGDFHHGGAKMSYYTSLADSTIYNVTSSDYIILVRDNCEIVVPAGQNWDSREFKISTCYATTTTRFFISGKYIHGVGGLDGSAVYLPANGVYSFIITSGNAIAI